MKIQLRDIPTEGKYFEWTAQEAGLKQILSELLGSRPFKATMHITPLQPGSFEIRGTFQSEAPEQCSRCGEDFLWPVNEVFREILVPQMPLPRDGKMSRVNHISDLEPDSPSVVEYLGEDFDAGEYLHSIVTLACPPNPAPAADAAGNCSTCKISLRNHSFGYDEDFEQPESPFSVLKNIKLN